MCLRLQAQRGGLRLLLVYVSSRAVLNDTALGYLCCLWAKPRLSSALEVHEKPALVEAPVAFIHWSVCLLKVEFIRVGHMKIER